MTRFSQYRIMWVIVLFDLPTDTSEDRKTAAQFRKTLLKDGFQMLQFSIYVRYCSSDENAKVHIQRTKRSLPERGHVGILKITDKQFGLMELFYGIQKAALPGHSTQLMLF